MTDGTLSPLQATPASRETPYDPCWLATSFQTEMAKALGLKVHYTAVSHFELGTREPSLEILLKYARLAGISMEVLVDDKLDLPRGLL